MGLPLIFALLKGYDEVKPSLTQQSNSGPFTLTPDSRIREKTTALYAQANGSFELFSNPAHLDAGLRYEKTDVTSSALVPIPTSSAWVAANEFDLTFGGESDFTTFTGKYQELLPNIDFDFRPRSDVVVRASASTTITRPDYASMQGGRTLDQLYRIGGGTGSQGNPGLKPYKSNNIDLSAEWYYGPDSYLSVGYFHKDVSNFISTTRIDTTAFDMKTPYGGPRYNAAVAAVGADGNIRQYIFEQYTNAAYAALGSGASYQQVVDYVNANYADEVHLANTLDSSGNISGQIIATAADPDLNFQITTPTNSDQTSALYGWEFNIQHTFGGTGFGVIANYTKVDGDAKYDPTQPASVTQFALTGLSDSANLVGFYDKNGIQARIAYNWRAKFLSGTGPNPTYVDDYGQFDASASWEFKPGLTAFIEGINLTNESRRVFGRSYNNVKFVAPGYARYSVGFRYAF